MTEKDLRAKVVKTAKSWLGAKQGDSVHKHIIDTYNSHKPLARGYVLKYTDPWCAGTVSADAIAADLTDIIPTECSCGKMIELFKKLGRWQENDAHVPLPADIIFYDWNDNGFGDCTGAPEHVGIVTECDGVNITVIEGNKNKAVGYRKMKVNGRYIRGYGVPDYAKKASSSTIQVSTPSGIDAAVYVVAKGDTLSKIAAKHGTSVSALASLNGIADFNSIVVGQVIFLTQAAAAIGKLAKLKVISSPDYWQKVVANGSVKYLDNLFIKASERIVKTGPCSVNVENAVNDLVSAGVVNAPSYWLENRNAYYGLEKLLCELGGSVKKR